MSPVQVVARAKRHTTPRHEAMACGASSRKLELIRAASARTYPPRPHIARHIHDAKRAIEKHDVDGEPHTEGVDAAERVGKEETGVELEAVATEESARSARTECGCDLDGAQHHRVSGRIDDLEHGTILQRLARTAPRVRVPECDGTRVHLAASARQCLPPSPLRYAPRMLCEDFHSGDDVTLGFLGRTYSFARKDFDQRVLRAAIDLELVTKPVSRGEREDLLAAVIRGSVEAPRSEAGERIVELQARDGEDPVYWLRKLVFRSAWLDHRIKHGQVDIAYDDSVGAFRIEPGKYPLPGSGHPSFAVTEASA